VIRKNIFKRLKLRKKIFWPAPLKRNFGNAHGSRHILRIINIKTVYAVKSLVWKMFCLSFEVVVKMTRQFHRGGGGTTRVYRTALSIWYTTCRKRNVFYNRVHSLLYLFLTIVQHIYKTARNPPVVFCTEVNFIMLVRLTAVRIIGISYVTTELSCFIGKLNKIVLWTIK
jgi:hypothetical protein